MERKIQSKKRYLWSFIIGTAIFIIVFLVSYSISYLEFQRVSNLQGNIAYDIFEHKLDYSFFNLGTCNNESFKKVSEDLGFQGSIINDLEGKLGKENKVVLEKKKFYTLIELEHFEFVNMLNKDCGTKVNTILFFYSNDKDDVVKSEDTGRLLDVLYSKNTDNLVIYSFDVNLESDLIKNLMEKYHVETSPTLVVNGNTRLFNPKNINEVENLLK
ncbi:MAG: hypothetical protein WC584_03910 [Candidatus Pacearchaeota archaeon]